MIASRAMRIVSFDVSLPPVDKLALASASGESQTDVLAVSSTRRQTGKSSLVLDYSIVGKQI